MSKKSKYKRDEKPTTFYLEMVLLGLLIIVAIVMIQALIAPAIGDIHSNLAPQLNS